MIILREKKKSSRIIQYVVVRILDGVRVVREKFKNFWDWGGFMVLLIYSKSLDYIILIFFIWII